MKKAEKPSCTCKDCSHARDFHDKDAKGNFFMCKCDFFTTSRFLRHDYCEHFKKR